MITVRRNNERGHADHGWLDSHHTFSFANYYDPKHMGFRSLRVINEDRVAPGRGFGAHPHQDMEILSYVRSGKLAHKDSMGQEEVLGPNEIQKMSAGTGVFHSEYNGSQTDPVHFFQIWIEPKQRGIKPSYEQLKFDESEKQNRFKVLASPTPVAGAATINQDAKVSVAVLDPATKLDYAVDESRHVWLHVVEGDVAVNGQQLQTGDAAAVSNEHVLEIATNGSKSEVLVFDLA
ncbi:pirin family protein [Silvibacterium acidisoli]|uniref:pirin family protein n=1 Tax=Acidobacteriaceae bacterium ZG23-2 TaxID=2883246 RepID=UPI00406D0C4F